MNTNCLNDLMESGLIKELVNTFPPEKLLEIADKLTASVTAETMANQTTEAEVEKHTYREVYEACFKDLKEETIANETSPSALVAFKSVNEKYVLNGNPDYCDFADEYVEDLTVYRVKTAKKKILTNAKNRAGETLSHKRLVDILMYIDKVFKYAADMNYISVVTYQEIKIMKVGGKKQKSKQITRNYLDEYEYGIFREKYDEIAFAYFKGNKDIRVSMLHDQPVDSVPVATFRCLLYKALFSLVFWTGARIDESRGIKWKDLIEPTDDFPLYKVKYEHQYKEKGAKLIGLDAYTKKPKTDDSVRICTVNVNCIKDLLELKRYLIVNDKYDHNQYIFYDFYCKTPKPVPYSNVNRHFKYFIDATDLEKQSMVLNGEHRNITLHGNRHAACSCLFQRGMSIEDIAAFLGHADIQTTKVYTHIFDPAHQAADKKIKNIDYFMY